MNIILETTITSPFFVSAFSGFICSEKSTSKTSTLFWGASSVYSSSSLRPSKFWNFCKKNIIRFEIEENLSCVKLFSTGWSNSVLYKNFWVSLYSQSIWIVSANFFKCRALWLEHNSPVSYEYRSPSEKALALTWAQVRQDEYTNDILEDLKLRVRQGLVKYTHRLWDIVGIVLMMNQFPWYGQKLRWLILALIIHWSCDLLQTFKAPPCIAAKY